MTERWCDSNSPLAIGPNACTGTSFISAQGYQNSKKNTLFARSPLGNLHNVLQKYREHFTPFPIINVVYTVEPLSHSTLTKGEGRVAR